MGVLDRLRTRTAPQDETEHRGTPRVVLAAAMPMSGPGVQRVSQTRQSTGVDTWQRDAWHFYDAVGELRAPINWIANAVSRADVYAAEVDTETGKVSGPTDDDTAQRAAAAVLGGMATRAQLQWLLAVCWQVPGEAFVVVRPQPAKRGIEQPDQWLVLSGTRVKSQNGRWSYTDPMTGETVKLGTQDRLIRVWSPHPEDQSKADSAVRAAIPALHEVEKSSQNIASRLDSRLAGNGLLFIPEEIDFPLGDHETKALAFADYLYTAMEASLANPGTAAGQVPIVATLPGEFINQIQHLDVSTEFDSGVVELRREALSRLAASLDMPKQVAEGSQGEANHWSAWKVDEDTFRIFIEPLLDRIGDALTEHWYHPMLEAMGVQDPGRFVLAWDTHDVVSRPDDKEDLDRLYDLGLISDDYRRAKSGIPDDAVPDEDESRRRLLERIVMGAPTLLADPTVARELLGIEIAPAAVNVDQSAPGTSDQEVTDAGSERELPSVPGQRTEEGTPDTRTDVPDGLVAAAELLVFDALSRAGGRLLTREHRGQFGHVAKQELHTVIRADDVPRLMEGSFQFADRVAEQFGISSHWFGQALVSHTYGLLTQGRAYDRVGLRAVLQRMFRDHPAR